METIKCPCCGGQTTNILNCDYCGSYLVQLAVKGASIDLGTFGPAASCIDKLQKALQSNLNKQIEARGNNHIRTSIVCKDNKVIVCNPKAINDYYSLLGNYAIPKVNINGNEVGLILVIQTRDYNLLGKYSTSGKKERKIRVTEQLKLNWFKQTSVSKLFKHEKSSLYSEIWGIIGTLNTFYLNFGKDYAGAAVAISQLLYGTNQISPDDPQITISESNITDKRYNEGYQEFVQRIKKEDKKWLYAAIFLILFFVSIILFDSDKGAHGLVAIFTPVYGAIFLYRFLGNLKRKL